MKLKFQTLILDQSSLVGNLDDMVRKVNSAFPGIGDDPSGDNVFVLPCDEWHVFHEKCLNLYISVSGGNWASVRCPTCRIPIIGGRQVIDTKNKYENTDEVMMEVFDDMVDQKKKEEKSEANKENKEKEDEKEKIYTFKSSLGGDRIVEDYVSNSA